jgi:hypothetical protein
VSLVGDGTREGCFDLGKGGLENLNFFVGEFCAV